MPKQYMMCGIEGTGTRTDPYIASVGKLSGVNADWIIPTGANGRPTRTDCLALVSATNLAPALALAGVDAFPAITLTTLLSTLSNPVRTNLQNKLTARGFPSNIVATSVTLGDLIEKVGQFLEPGFKRSQLVAGG